MRYFGRSAVSIQKWRRSNAGTGTVPRSPYSKHRAFANARTLPSDGARFGPAIRSGIGSSGSAQTSSRTKRSQSVRSTNGRRPPPCGRSITPGQPESPPLPVRRQRSDRRNAGVGLRKDYDGPITGRFRPGALRCCPLKTAIAVRIRLTAIAVFVSNSKRRSRQR